MMFRTKIISIFLFLLILVPHASAEIIAFDDFESGSLGSMWSLYGEGGVSNALPAAEGDYFAYLKINPVNTLAYMTTWVDLSNYEDVNLSFWAGSYHQWPYDDTFLVGIWADGFGWETLELPTDNQWHFYDFDLPEKYWGKEVQFGFGYQFNGLGADGEFMQMCDYNAVLIDAFKVTGVNPVPEPASLVLFTAGLMGCAAFRRKRS